MSWVTTWRPRTALPISVVAVFCMLLLPLQTAAYPAPPNDVSGQETTLLDAGRATPPPITEEELHQMIEELLMEAYGDEYEPPASKFKTASLPKSKNLPVPKPKRPPSKSKSLDLPSTSSPASPFVHEGDVLSTVFSPRPQSGGRLLPRPTIVPTSKSNTQLRETRPVPRQLASFLQNVPDVRTKSVSTSASIPTLPKPTAKISKLSSTSMPLTVPVTIAQTLTSSELMGAVLVEQDDQPNILIVDRRTKNKEAKVLNADKPLGDFQRNSRSPVANNAPSATPVIVSEPRAPVTPSAAAETPDVTVVPQIRPATLLSHIKSEGNKPFKSVDGSSKRTTSRPVKNNLSTTDKNVIQLSPAPVARSQATALPVETPTAKPQATALPRKKQNAAKSFLDDGSFDSPNAFTLPNLEPVNNPSSTPILDIDDVNDEDLLLLELLGSRMNKAGFGSKQSITPAVRLGSPKPTAFTSPNLQQASNPSSTPILDVDDVDDEDLMLLELLGSRMNKAGFGSKQSITPAVRLGSPEPTAFTSNLQQASNPPSTPILDVDDVDDEDLMLLELLGSRMNKAGFRSEQSITPAVRLGSSLNPPTSTRKSSTRRQNENLNSIRLSETGQSRASQIPGVFSDDDKIVIDLATIGSRDTPLPLLTGNRNNQGNFLTGKEIGVGNEQQSQSTSNHPTPSRVNSLDTQIDSRMTVGDLIRSLDGLNGIQVLSLSDLRNQQESGGVSAHSTGTTIAEHLRATMLTKTTENGAQSVGIPLPTIGTSNSIAAQGAVQVASENPGRQFEQTGGLEPNSVFDNFFDESTRTSGTVDDVGIPLTAVADNANSPATTDDSFSTTLDDTNGFPLEENTDFNFEEYEDDFDDLPAQPESVFRRGISDIFFTKGQWLGTLLGGVVDIGSSIGESVSKLFNKSGSSS